jgi:hypothetical protein
MYTSGNATLDASAIVGDVFEYQTDLGLSWQDYFSDQFLGSLVYEQSLIANTWDAFKPDPFGNLGISGVFQYNDKVYAARDFWGGKFEAGEKEPDIGDIIQVGNFSAHVAGVKLVGGSWEGLDAEGTLYLYPGPTTSLTMADIGDWDSNALVNNLTQANVVGTTLTSTDRQYENKGLLWKLDTGSGQGGWSLVDMGFSASFEDGLVAPQATVAPLITTDSLSKISDTGLTDHVSPAMEYPTTGTYSAWSNLGNLDSTTPGAYASSTLATSDYSRILKLQMGDGVTNVIEGEARILGLEVQITCHQTAGTDVLINKVQLRNDKTGATQYLSANRAENSALTTTPGTTYTYGSQLDTWELDEIDQADINSGDLKVIVQFQNTNGSSTRTVNVDLIQFKFHVAYTGQDVYFYDGSSDVDTGTLYAYQVFDGDWSTDDAEGWMTLYGLTAPSDIVPGTQIRSAASGGGDLIASVRTVSKNLLPSLEEMDEEGSIYQSRRGTFSGNEDSEAVYVATGAGPAFTVDREDRFSFIRLPIDRGKDKPRYVEIHRNHLALATGSHLLVSSIGSPNNFQTYDGATTWSLKDRVTGLAAAPRGTTLVVCEDSIHVFTGTGASGPDAFAMRILTDNGGARDYTITNLLGNIFVDYNGITTADVSDKYGGFDLGRRSKHIRPLLQGLIGTDSNDDVVGNRIIGSLPIRKKNQYRTYLSNGDILTATFPEDPQQPLQYTLQNYTAYYEDEARGYEATFAPTAMDSSVLSTGDESVVIGTRLGHVMRVDPRYLDILSYANKTIDGTERRDDLTTWKLFKFIDLNPIHANDAAQGMHYKSAEVYLQHAGYGDLNRLYRTDYEYISEIPTADVSVGDLVTFGDITDFPGKPQDDYFTWYIDEMTDGLCVRLSKFGGEGVQPLRISHMHMHVDMRADRQTRQHNAHAYEVTPSALPQDYNWEGVTGTAVAANGDPFQDSGTWTINKLWTGTTGTATAAGGTGTFNLGPHLWDFSETSPTFDDITDTWDGLTAP